MYGVEEVRAEKEKECHRTCKPSPDQIQKSPELGGLQRDIGPEKCWAHLSAML
jgi:hypothetical protein